MSDLIQNIKDFIEIEKNITRYNDILNKLKIKKNELETNIEKINSLEANIGSKDKELTDQKKESQEYIDISNDRLTDLLSRLSLVN